MNTLEVHRSNPPIALEAKLCDELLSPAGDDGLTGWVSRGMIVLTALGAGLRVASGPEAHVYAIDRGAVLLERMTNNQLTQSFFVGPPAVQRGV
jgi:hypothetical protein